MPRLRPPTAQRASLIALCLAAACSAPLEIPNDAQLDCSASACPSGWTCTATHRCVPTAAVDVRPPAVASFSVAPAVARAGVDPVLTLEVSEPLSVDPVIRVDVGTARQLRRLTGASPGLVYTYGYARAGDEPQGTDCPVTVDLTDSQGVVASGLSAGPLRFDDVAPRALAPAVSGSPVRSGGTVRVTFTASEPLASDPVVVAGDTYAFTKDPASSGLDYVYVRTSDGTEPEGADGLALSASLTDPAGNTAEVALGAAVFDRRAPGLVAPAALAPAAAAAGTLVRVSFTADEDLGADPVVRLGAITLDKGAQAGRAYTYSHVVSTADGEGDLPLTIALQDLAGNGSGPLQGASVRFDFHEPTVGSLLVCDDDGSAAPCAADQRVFSDRPGHDRMKISFTLGERAATLQVTVAGRLLGDAGPESCRSADGLGWVCSAIVTDPLQGASPRTASATVAVTAVDASGNAGTTWTFATWDFRPPGLAGTPYFERCDSYDPARAGPNDLWVKPVASFSGAACPFTHCGLSGPVRIQLTLDEAVTLGAAGIRLDDGTPLQLAACASSATQLVAVLGADGGAGDRQVLADVVDATGNARTLTLGTLRLDATAPAAPDTATADRVLFQRFPWGADGTGGAKGYFLRGAAGAVAAGASVVAFDGPNAATAAEIGRTRADGTGGFGGAPGTAAAFAVASGDVPEIFVAQEDAAGNRSPPALVWDGQWTATPGFKEPGKAGVNPNVFAEETALRDSRFSPAQQEPADPTLAAAMNGAGILTAGGPDLRQVAADSITPPTLGDCRMAYDPDLGRAVMFGGYWSVQAVGTFWGADTYAWDGRGWTQLDTPEMPPVRAGHGFAYDEARRRFVLFGGTSGSPAVLLGDTWELDGSSWRRVCWPGCTAGECTCTAMPSPRTDAATFYDPVTGHVIVAGGTAATGARADTWRWDGRDWTQLAPATSPPAHAGAQVAVAPELGQTMLLLGAGGTWFWDGATWTGFAGVGAASETSDLWWDPLARTYRQLTMAGAVMSTWNGASWDAAPGFPTTGDVSGIAGAYASKRAMCGAYDRERGGYLRFGGCSDASCRVDYQHQQHTAFVTSETIRQLAPGVHPVERVGAAVSDFPPDGGAWLFGGRNAKRYAYLDNWAWDGATWRTDGLADDFYGIFDAAMAYLGAGRLVRYAGIPAGGGVYTGAVNTWVHTSPGFAWTAGNLVNPATYVEPITRTDQASQDDQALAWDEANGNGLFFRGQVGGTSTWTGAWDAVTGILWTPRATGSAPASVRGHRLAYCNGSAILFGGRNAGGTYLDETWSWSGSAWTLRTPAQRPPARAGHAMFCDKLRGKLVVIGGQDASGERADVWQYDGTTWRELEPGERPSPRHGMGAAYDSTAGRGLLFGGAGNGYHDDTWLWDGGRDRRPAHLFHARFGAAGAADATIQGVSATLRSGATGYWLLGSTNGARLLLRDGGQWRQVGSNTAPPGAPATLAWSTANDPAFAAGSPGRLRRLFSGDTLDLTVAATPAANNWIVAGGATVNTRYVEVQVRYRLACLAAGKATTNALRCCSGAMSGNACQ